MRPSVHAGWSPFSRACRRGADAAGAGLFCKAQRAFSRMIGVGSTSNVASPETDEAEPKNGSCSNALRREGSGALV
ncbi:MAG: hypothetical protein ACK55I_20630, partial [bacterium]